MSSVFPKLNEDFYVVNASAPNQAGAGEPVPRFLVRGPNVVGILGFDKKEEAETKARELARAAKVSVWDKPDPNRDDVVLIETFRT